MSSAAATLVKNQATDQSEVDASPTLTDGFQLVIDALKLNGIKNL
jgi:oxalyl-CoA decarboxylase